MVYKKLTGDGWVWPETNKLSAFHNGPGEK